MKMNVFLAGICLTVACVIFLFSPVILAGAELKEGKVQVTNGRGEGFLTFRGNLTLSQAIAAGGGMSFEKWVVLIRERIPYAIRREDLDEVHNIPLRDGDKIVLEMGMTSEAVEKKYPNAIRGTDACKKLAAMGKKH